MQFNSRLQPTQIQAGGLLTLGFTYGTTNNTGNVLTQTIDPPDIGSLTQSYTYDSVNRLSGITEGGWSRAYAYDAYGNRAATGAAVFADTPQNASDFEAATNRLTSAWAGYDAAGNLTTFKPDGFEWTASYDADNKQTAFCPGTESACNGVVAGSKTTYDYDGDGNRVRKVVNDDEASLYVYDAFGNLAAEYADSAPPGPAGTQYRTTDHLGSTRIVTDATPAPNTQVLSRRDFFPFGEEIMANATFGNRDDVKDGQATTTYNDPSGYRQQFTSKERDDESGLDYFGARYYGASLGRFASPDPLVLYGGTPSDPQSWNKYAYARNNPLLYTDPTGMKYTICDNSGNCYDDYSDADFDKNLSLTAKDGVLYDEDGNQVGTYQRTSFDDLSLLGNLLFNQMSARRQASNQFIGAFAVVSVAVGTGGGVIANSTGLTAGSGLTSLEIGGTASQGVVGELLAADLTYTQTVANNFAQVTSTGVRARPYDLKLVVQEIMKRGTPKPDPGGIAGGLRWDVPGTMNGSKGVWELVVNPTTKQIVHFLFKGVK